ncbi:MAG: beta-ketoacyl synthase chain length factor [Paludibacteraceae bacterium]|nr:beta-ketoacyl synthase chain length factor [Paludibacteraceae bacterium]
MKMNVHITHQISIQPPFETTWIDNPIAYTEPYVRAIDPDFKAYMSAGEARRLGKVLKRALAVSLRCLQESQDTPIDAVITGTGLGSIESTESFLTELCQNGEQLLKPTPFMQSTHNTIGSLVAISTKNHGYNATYAHKSISFQSALYDAWLQFKLRTIQTALVGAHDGLTEAHYELLNQIDYLGSPVVGSEVAMATILSGQDTPQTLPPPMCVVSGIKLLYKPTFEQVQQAVQNMVGEFKPTDAVMMGVNGNPQNDAMYQPYRQTLFANVPCLQYKHVFGECYSAPAMAFYATAHLLQKGNVPAHFVLESLNGALTNVQRILLFEYSTDGNCSIILMGKP